MLNATNFSAKSQICIVDSRDIDVGGDSCVFPFPEDGILPSCNTKKVPDSRNDVFSGVFDSGENRLHRNEGDVPPFSRDAQHYSGTCPGINCVRSPVRVWIIAAKPDTTVLNLCGQPLLCPEDVRPFGTQTFVAPNRICEKIAFGQLQLPSFVSRIMRERSNSSTGIGRPVARSSTTHCCAVPGCPNASFTSPYLTTHPSGTSRPVPSKVWY
ncbi:hypothetical protein BH11ACT7_BH11ACT7_26180 [soil metagenome]